MPRDQHVEEVLDLDGYPFVLKGWHFGSDIDCEEYPYSKAWAVAVNLEKRKCKISNVLIVNEHLWPMSRQGPHFKKAGEKKGEQS